MCFFVKASLVRAIPVIIQEGPVAGTTAQAEAKAFMERVIVIPLTEGDVRRRVGSTSALTVLAYATSNTCTAVAKSTGARYLRTVRATCIDVAGAVP